jgi:hypothetical protein
MSGNVVRWVKLAFAFFLVHMIYAFLLGGLGLIAGLFISAAFGGGPNGMAGDPFSGLMMAFLIVVALGVGYIYVVTSFIGYLKRTQTASLSQS